MHLGPDDLEILVKAISKYLKKTHGIELDAEKIMETYLEEQEKRRKLWKANPKEPNPREYSNIGLGY